MPVRREGYCLEAEGNPDAASAIWKRALLDRHASVRELARYFLGKTGNFDPAAFYRQALVGNEAPLAVISGLAECGDKRDLGTLRNLLAHPQPKFRRAAIRGIARIAQEDAIDDLLRSIADESPGVIREASLQIEPFLNLVPGQSLFAIVVNANSEHARKTALRLIVRKGKWQSMPWLIRLAAHADEAIASQARQFIVAWFTPPMCNRVFTRPTSAERADIEQAMQDLRGQLPSTLLEPLGAGLRGP